MELFDNMLKHNDLDFVPIPCPLMDSFEPEFRTGVVTCEAHSSEFFWNLELEVLGRNPSLRAPAAHGVSSCAKRSFRPWVPENQFSFSSSFVRIIIDFCEGDMEGASPLLSTGSLNF